VPRLFTNSVAVSSPPTRGLASFACPTISSVRPGARHRHRHRQSGVHRRQSYMPWMLLRHTTLFLEPGLAR
jgi:hypothetical protein